MLDTLQSKLYPSKHILGTLGSLREMIICKFWTGTTHDSKSTSFSLSFILKVGWIFLPPVMFLVALIRYHIFDLGWLSTTCTPWSATTSSFKMPFLEVRRNAGSNFSYNINTNTGMRLFPLVIHLNIVQNIFSQRKLVSPLKLQ